MPMQQTGIGVYEAEVTFPILGLWDILVSVKMAKTSIIIPTGSAPASISGQSPATDR